MKEKVCNLETKEPQSKKFFFFSCPQVQEQKEKEKQKKQKKMRTSEQMTAEKRKAKIWSRQTDNTHTQDKGQKGTEEEYSLAKEKEF